MTDLIRFQERVETIHLNDEEIDFWLAAYVKGHPNDDGNGRWTKVVLEAFNDLYADPRRIPSDEAPPTKGR